MKSWKAKKSLLRILVYLLDHGETNFQRIVDDSNLYDRIVRNSLPILKDAGLVSTRIDDASYPPKNMISLTEKGKNVANKLKEIETLLIVD